MSENGWETGGKALIISVLSFIGLCFLTTDSKWVTLFMFWGASYLFIIWVFDPFNKKGEE